MICMRRYILHLILLPAATLLPGLATAVLQVNFNETLTADWSSGNVVIVTDPLCVRSRTGGAEPRDRIGLNQIAGLGEVYAYSLRRGPVEPGRASIGENGAGPGESHPARLGQLEPLVSVLDDLASIAVDDEYLLTGRRETELGGTRDAVEREVALDLERLGVEHGDPV